MHIFKQQLATKIGIVTTVADAAEHIEFFIQYHLSIGIHHILLFIDDGCERTYQIALKYEEVTPIFVDENLAECWKSLPVYRNMEKRKLKDKEVMIRQEYNVHIGFVLAKEKGIDWLLHIDLDELFYPNGICLDSHYKELEKADIGGCVYLNYEAIPVADGGSCIYTTTPFFKKNFFKKGHWFFNEEQTAFLAETDWLSQFYFNYYQNGKAAANLSHDLVVEDVHAMWGNGKRLHFQGHTDPIILHFPSITLTEFRKKYKRLGKFDDLWKGHPRVGKFIDPLHLDARDAYVNGDSSAFDELYRSRIQVSPQNVKLLISLGLATEINEIRQFGKDFKERCVSNARPRESIVSNGVDKKPSLLRSQTVSLNKLAMSSSERMQLIGFPTLGEARKWIRRHPRLCGDPSCSTLARSQFVVTYNSVPLCDLELAESVSTVADLLSRELTHDNALIIDVREPLCTRVYSERTPFDFLVEKIKVLKRIINSVDKRKRDGIFIQIMDDQEYLLGLEGRNIVSTEINAAIENFNRTNSLSPLATFLRGRYPKRLDCNYAIQLPEEELVPKGRKGCLEALLFSLGGTILYRIKQPSPLSERLSSIRNKHTIVKDTYASALEHIEEMLVIKKEDRKQRFLGIMNFGKSDSLISSLQLPELFEGSGWIDLMSEQPCTFGQAQVVVPAEQFIWLIQTKTEVDLCLEKFH